MTSRKKSSAPESTHVRNADEPEAALPRHVGLSTEQRYRLPPFRALCAFEAVGTYGGVRRAAFALSRDHASVSRHLRAIEAWAGVPLIERSDGRLTAQGAKFHARVAAAMKEIAAASTELTHRGDERRLHLWCVPGIASQWLAPRLGAFASAYSNIDLELQPTDAMPNFHAHEADAAVRYVPDVAAHSSPDAELCSIEIARPAVLAVASPKFLASLKPIAGPADLLSAALLHEANFDQWRHWFAAQGVDAKDMPSGPRLWQGHLTVAAAKRGQGIALSNTFLIGDDLRSGALVQVPLCPPVYLGSYVFIARRDRWRDRVILCFRRWLEQSVAWQVPLSA